MIMDIFIIVIYLVLFLMVMELLTRVILAIKFKTIGTRHFLDVLKNPIGGFDWRVFQRFGDIRNRAVKNLFRFSTQSEDMRISDEKLQDIMAKANDTDCAAIIEKYTGAQGFEKSRYRPFVGFSTRPHQNLSFADIDRFGFQGNYNSIDKPPNTKRVLLLGGSAAFGMGAASKSRNLTVQLAKHLNNKEKASGSAIRWEVINMAFVASQSISELNQATIYSNLFSPDIILQLSGYNDLYFFVNEHENAKLYTYNYQDSVINYLKSPLWMKSLDQLASYSFMVRVLQKFIRFQPSHREEQLYTVW